MQGILIFFCVCTQFNDQLVTPYVYQHDNKEDWDLTKKVLQFLPDFGGFEKKASNAANIKNWSNLHERKATNDDCYIETAIHEYNTDPFPLPWWLHPRYYFHLPSNFLLLFLHPLFQSLSALQSLFLVSQSSHQLMEADKEASRQVGLLISQCGEEE